MAPDVRYISLEPMERPGLLERMRGRKAEIMFLVVLAILPVPANISCEISKGESVLTHPRSTPGRNWDSVPIDRNWVIQRILELPGEIEEAEYGVIVATIDVENAKTALKDKEAALFNEGKVPVKNYIGETGEVVPGVAIIERPEKFLVEVVI